MKNFSIFLSFFIITNQAFSQNLDIDILKDINLHRNKNYDNTYKGISFSVYPVSISIPAAMVCAGIIKKDSITKEKGIYTASSIILAEGIAFGLKYAINRERPYKTYSFIQNVATEPTPSFPSGHTSGAFATATSLSLAYTKWYIIAPSFLWACTVAYSRLDLGVHYPSDVLGGAIIGAGSSYLCFKANQWLHKQKMFGKKTKLL